MNNDSYPAPLPLQDDWLRRAELAVQKNEDELAKEALKRRKAYQVHGGGRGTPR